MNKKEISEIKKTLNPENSVITRICGCYVDGAKEVKFKSREAFHTLNDDEAFKYFDIFKHTMSGGIGKNLFNIEFSTGEEMEGGKQEELLKLRNSKLDDEELLDKFYQKVIDSYIYPSSYYIILIHGVYDIPGKYSDGTEMYDASDNVYEYILCSICPVKLAKSGLSYDADANCIIENIRNWLVSTPANGFLFPAFNDRNSDVHSLLYYTKNEKEIQSAFIENLCGTNTLKAAPEQKKMFSDIVKDTLGDECDFETVKSIYETLNEMIDESKYESEALIITSNDIKGIFEVNGISGEKLQELEKQLSAVGDITPVEFFADNIANARKFNIETPDVQIKVNPDRTDLIGTRIIDGKRYVLIPMNDIKVNGISVI